LQSVHPQKSKELLQLLVIHLSHKNIIENQHPNFTWLASRNMGRTVGISSAIMYILSWVGNHHPFPRVFDG
jgi:hypothetical protein